MDRSAGRAKENITKRRNSCWFQALKPYPFPTIQCLGDILARRLDEKELEVLGPVSFDQGCGLSSTTPPNNEEIRFERGLLIGHRQVDWLESSLSGYKKSPSL